MSGNTSLGKVLRYRFDNFMARGGSSIFIVLVVVFLSLWSLIAITRMATHLMLRDAPNERVDQFEGELAGESAPFVRNLYITFLQMTDPGNMAQDIESSASFKIFSISAGLVGVVLLSSLIAFITTALDQKIGELKKGHSHVVEDDHTLILGWNERVVEILRELEIANESEDDACAVILSRREKEFMDDFIKLNFSSTPHTRVVTRSGLESSLVNLEIVSVATCKSAIVLALCSTSATDEEKAASDSHVIKTILALVTSRPVDVRLNIVAEIFFSRNRQIVLDISPGEISVVDSDTILAKILVQTSRSVGLSVVYGEILSFDGCEMYFHEADWGGVTFGEMPYRFPDGVPMGLRHEDGTIAVNPPVDTKLQPGDAVLILAEDDSTIEWLPSPVAQPRQLTLAGGRIEPGIEQELIIGWNPKVEIILDEYADYLLPGSRIDVMLRSPDDSVRAEIEAMNARHDKIDIGFVEGDPLRTDGLLAVRPFEYDNIVILSQGGHDDERTDSETIIILLLLRNIFDAHPERTKLTKLITEVLDSDNQPLVARTGVNDFIISNRFVSMLLAQISEHADIQTVYDDLFSEEGSEIYLKPASLYFSEFPQTVTYADMIAIAQQREEICLGVKIKAYEGDLERNFGVKLIPEKNTSYELTAEDSLVVLAEDET